MPLTERVSFKTRLQRYGRLLVDKHVRQRYKLDSTQCLSVRVSFPGIWDSSESFLGKMTQDGRIDIPKLTMAILTKKNKQPLEGYVVEVILEPF